MTEKRVNKVSRKAVAGKKVRKGEKRGMVWQVKEYEAKVLTLEGDESSPVAEDEKREKRECKAKLTLHMN